MDLAPIVTGLVTGLGVAYLTFWLQRGLERERWAREDRLRREELDRQAAVRWLDEKRQLFAGFLKHIEALRATSRQLYDADDVKAWDKHWDEAYDLTVEITLLEPSLEDAVDAVYFRTTDLVTAALKWAGDNSGDAALSVPEQPDLDAREKPLNSAIDTFMAAASSRLRPERLQDKTPTTV